MPLNLDIPNEHCGVSVEIVDHRFVPIEGYARTDCHPLAESGFRQVVRWGSRDTILHVKGQIRIRVAFTGVRFEDLKLFAIYLDSVSSVHPATNKTTV